MVNMNILLVVCVLVSVSVAAPAIEDAQAKIHSYESENDGHGNYEFSFETSNGIKQRERGVLVNVGQNDEHLKVDGDYSYTDPEGKLVFVRYYADENGYHTEQNNTDDDDEDDEDTFFGAGLPAAAVATLLG